MAMRQIGRNLWINTQHILQCSDDPTAQPPTLGIRMVGGANKYETDYKLQGDERDVMLVWLRTQAAPPLDEVGEA